MRKKISKYIRIVVGLGLIVYLGTTLDLEELYQTFLLLPYWIWAVAVLLGFGAVLVSCFKLDAFLKVCKLQLNIWKLYSVYLIGLFIGNFLPSTIGGDIIKYAYIKKTTNRGADAIAAIFMERFTGLLALLVIALGAAAYSQELSGEPVIIWFLLLLNIGAILCFLILRAVPATSREVPKTQSAFNKLRATINKAHLACRAVGRSNYAMANGMVNSMMFVFIAIITSQLFAIGLGQKISIGNMALIVALVQLITMLPISVNGIGVREWSYVVLLGRCGISPEIATAISLMTYLTVLMVSISGGILLLFSGKDVEAYKIEALSVADAA